MRLAAAFTVAVLVCTGIYGAEGKGHGGRGGHGRGGGHGHGGGHSSGGGGHSVSSAGSHSSSSSSSSGGGSYGSSGGTHGTSSGGGHGSDGSYGGSHASGGSYGGSHGSDGSYGGSHGSGGSYGGSHGSGGSYGGSHGSGGYDGSSSDSYGGSHVSGYGGSHGTGYGGSRGSGYGGNHGSGYEEGHGSSYGGSHGSSSSGRHINDHDSDSYSSGTHGGRHSDSWDDYKYGSSGYSPPKTSEDVLRESQPWFDMSTAGFGGHKRPEPRNEFEDMFPGIKVPDFNLEYKPGVGFRIPGIDDAPLPSHQSSMFDFGRKPTRPEPQNDFDALFPDLKIPDFDSSGYKSGGGFQFPRADAVGHRSPSNNEKSTAEVKSFPPARAPAGDSDPPPTTLDSGSSVIVPKPHRNHHQHRHPHGHGSNSTTARPDNTTSSPSSAPLDLQTPVAPGAKEGSVGPQQSARLESPPTPPAHPLPLGVPHAEHPIQNPMQQASPGGHRPLGQPPELIAHPHSLASQPELPNYGQLIYGSAAMAQPIVPGQVIVLPSHSNPSPSLGQIAAEAFVHSAINAGVNRLINGPTHQLTTSPDQHQQSGGKTTINHSTTIISNNYGQPQESTSGAGAGLTGIDVGSRSSGIGEGQSAGRSSVATARYYISDDELMNLSETLFAKEEAVLDKYVFLNLQNKTNAEDGRDEASKVLLYSSPELFDLPTIRVLRNLLDNYEVNATVKEKVTAEMRKEQHLLVDTFFNTDIMTTAMNWLASKYYIEPDDFEMKDTLHRIWFNKIEGSTSAFERVFLAEVYPGARVLGAQNWIYFMSKEASNDVNYLGYTEEYTIADNVRLLKINLKIGDTLKLNSTMLVETSPELEMALYTICFYARPNDICPVSLGGHKFHLYTHNFRYFGKDLMDMGIIAF